MTPLNVTAVAEIGKAIHPMMAIGQIEGGTAQGIGYALIEEVVMKDGRMANAQLTNYIIPTPLDAAPMDIGIMERPYEHGPFGAKGVGEMPIDGPAPAVDQCAAPLRVRRPQHSRHAGAADVRLRSPSDRELRRDGRVRPRQAMKLTVNGKSRTVKAHPMKRLLDVLREDCGLTGTKEGCGEGECGACTVLVDGVAVDSCLVPVAHAEGRRVITIEGAAATKTGKALQNAFVVHGGAQCGICTPGMILAAAPLKTGASLDEIKTALAGNLCRCTGYPAIFRSVDVGAEDEGRRACRSPLSTLALERPRSLKQALAMLAGDPGADADRRLHRRLRRPALRHAVRAALHRSVGARGAARHQRRARRAADRRAHDVYRDHRIEDRAEARADARGRVA